jgi:hypothetical protein
VGRDDDGGVLGVGAGVTAVDIVQLILEELQQFQLFKTALDKGGPPGFGKGGGRQLLDSYGQGHYLIQVVAETL